MTTIPPHIQAIKAEVERQPNLSAALDVMEERLKMHRDSCRRINRRFGLYPSRVTPAGAIKGLTQVKDAARGMAKTVLEMVEKIGKERGYGDVSQLVDLSKPRPFRRLYWDIEVSPNVVLSWRVGRKINLDPSNIIKERAIICIAWKWAGERKVHHLTWDQHQNDKEMLVAFGKVAAEADEMIHQNGDRFDFPWLRTRSLFHGLPPLPDHKTIDTLKIARSRFAFNSNRLDYIGQYLGVGRKIETNYGLWKAVVLDNDRKALAKMVHYCCGDVNLLEGVFLKLESAAPPKTHIGVARGLDIWTCPRTGSTKVKVAKTRISAKGVPSYQMVNTETGGYYTISARAHEGYLAASRS